MNALKIGLDWFKDSKGYDVSGDGKSRTILERGGRLLPTQPLRNGMAFLAFSKVKSEPDLLDFVRHYGLLEQPNYNETFGRSVVDPKTLAPVAARPIIRGEYVHDHLDTAQMFQELLVLTGRRGKASKSLSQWIEERILAEKLGDVSMEFVSGRGFQICLKVDSLINGMLMQLALKVSGRAKFHFCQLCGLLFEVGPDARRRANATFCSREHKIKFHSHNRSRMQR